MGPGRGFSAAGPGALPEKQAMQKVGGRGTEERKKSAVIFKKPISYCRFVSADTGRTSVHAHSVVYLPWWCAQQKTAGGEDWGQDWVPSCPPFLREAHKSLLFQAWGYPALAFYSSQASTQLNIKKCAHSYSRWGTGRLSSPCQGTVSSEEEAFVLGF